MNQGRLNDPGRRPEDDHPMCAACSGVPWQPGQYAVIPREHIKARHPELNGNNLQYAHRPLTPRAMSPFMD